MRHTRVFGVGIPNSAHGASFGPPQTYFTCGSLSIWTKLRLEIHAHINFLSLVSSRAFRDEPHSRFSCGDPNQCLPNFVKTQLLALPQI